MFLSYSLDDLKERFSATAVYGQHEGTAKRSAFA